MASLDEAATKLIAKLGTTSGYILVIETSHVQFKHQSSESRLMGKSRYSTKKIASLTDLGRPHTPLNCTPEQIRDYL